MSRVINKQLINTDEFFVFISDFYLQLDPEIFLYHDRKRNIKTVFISTIDDELLLLKQLKKSNVKSIYIEKFESLNELFNLNSEIKKLTM